MCSAGVMEEGQNGAELVEMHPEDDNVLVEKNKKRTVKTRAQVQALEKFYSESKYPSEAMKIEFAESVGLTEKQVSGWFCHRRLKDKKSFFESYVAARQDRSSGVIQDHGSGHKQDSCGSTKQGDDRNFDTREVESGRLTLPEHSAGDEHAGLYSGDNNNMGDASSGSSSPLRSRSNHHNENQFDVATSVYLMPKYPMNVPSIKPRSGPSGYLKLKRPVENPAITAVKRQLGNQYQEDGPSLGVEFDPLPPGAFESTPDLIDGTRCAGEAVSPASPDILKIHQHSKFGKGREYNSNMPLLNSKMDRITSKAPQGLDASDNYRLQKFKQSSSPKNGGFYSWRSPERSARDESVNDNRGDYRMRYRHGVEDKSASPVPNNCHQQFMGPKFRMEQESNFHKHGEVSRKSLQGENIENDSFNLSMRGIEYHPSGDKMRPRQTSKVGKVFSGRSITNENPVEILYRSDNNAASKRAWNGAPVQPYMKKPTVAVKPTGISPVTRPTARIKGSSSEEEEDGGSAETSYSAE